MDPITLPMPAQERAGTQLSSAQEQWSAVSQIVAGTAHDLLNALQIIVTEAELLCEQESDPRQESVHTILDAGQHAAGMCRELLQLARVNMLDLAPLDPASVLDASRPLIERIARKAGVQCEFEAQPGLWSITVPPLQLKAALINLSVNARDAMPQGGRLRVAAQNVVTRGDLPPGRYVCLSVEDTGVGMAPEVRRRATEAFFTTKGPEHGTGLGLAMVQALAARAGGMVQIESQLGRGTCVRMLLPAARGSHKPPTAAGVDPLLDALHKRVRTPWMRAAVEAVRELYSGAELPRPAQLEAALAAYRARRLVLAVEVADAGGSRALRLLEMGDALLHLLEQIDITEPDGQGRELIQEIEGAYRRALSSARPSYEYARFRFGAGLGADLEAERLIFPASSDGRTLSHLFGLVMIPERVFEGE